MDSLVMCPCGHHLAAHGDDGCRGDARARCACRFDKTVALESAVQHARTRPWRPPGESPEERRTA